EFRTYFGEEKPISSVMFNTYVGTQILLDAIIKEKSFDREVIFNYISGKKMETACGTLRIGTRHLSRPVKVGKALTNGQFEIVWDSTSNIKPRPYKETKLHVNEIILNAWGRISEEAIIAVSASRVIQYMSQKAKEMTPLDNGDTITPRVLQQLKKLYQVNSYQSKSKTIFLLKAKIEKTFDSIYEFGSIQTKNQAFQMELETAKIAAQSMANVLILGETGTGKGVLAKSIHEQSERKNEPFIAVNTGAIPKDLIASELFGYV